MLTALRPTESPLPETLPETARAAFLFGTKRRGGLPGSICCISQHCETRSAVQVAEGHLSYSQRRRAKFPETNNTTSVVVWNYFFLMEASRMPLCWPTRQDFLLAWKLWEKLMFQHWNCSFMPIYGHDFTTYCAPLWHILTHCDNIFLCIRLTYELSEIFTNFFFFHILPGHLVSPEKCLVLVDSNTHRTQDTG